MKKTHLLVLAGSLILATSCTAVIVANNESSSPTDIGGGDNPLTNLTVTFDFNGGTYNEETSVTFDDIEPTSYFYYVKQKITGTVTPPTHYKFEGNYSLSPDGSTGIVSDNFIIKENNLTFYAQYYTDEHYATVHWMDGVVPTEPVLIQDEIYFTGETPSFKGTIPHHEGKAFDHWEPTIEPITDTDTDVIYTAIYVNAGKIHVVSLDYNNGSGGGEEIHYQTIVDKLTVTEPTITNPGKTLKDWTYVDGPEAGQVFDFSTQITKDINIQANWDDDVYNITYVTNGGSISGQETTAKYNDTLPNPTISRAGYSLEGWYTTPTFTAGSEFTFEGGATPTPIKGDTTIYAKWGEIKTFTIKFYDDSTEPIEYPSLEETIEYGHGAYRPADPIKSDCTFAGWYIDAAHTTKYTFDVPLTGATGEYYNAYAKFDYIKHRVTFNPMGGTIAADHIEVNQNATIETTDVPAVTSPTDMGEPTWYTDSSFTTPFIFGESGTKVATDMTLYAKYEIKAGDSFEDDSWTVFLNEIEGKSFDDIKTSDAYKDDYEVSGTFVGLTRNVDITNLDGTITPITATIVDENEDAQEDDNKFTFLIMIEDSATFNSTYDKIDNNFYPCAEIRRNVESFIYRFDSKVFARMQTVTETCLNPQPGGSSQNIDTKLFVPSVNQVFGGGTDEGTQFDLFADNKELIKGSWLRTSRNGDSGLAYYVNQEGASDYDLVTESYKVCAAFVIK